MELDKAPWKVDEYCRRVIFMKTGGGVIFAGTKTFAEAIACMVKVFTRPVGNYWETTSYLQPKRFFFLSHIIIMIRILIMEKFPYFGKQQIAFGQLTWDKNLGKHDLLLGAALRYTYYDDNSTATQDTLTGVNKADNILLPGIFLQDEITLNEDQDFTIRSPI
jgi:hypothetical protein